MKPETRRNHRPAIIAGCIALTANLAFYTIMVRPRIASYRDLAGSKGAFARELSEAERTQKTLAAFYERLDTTEKNIEDFFAKVLSTKQERLIQVQQELNDIGTEFRISPESVSYENKDMEADGLEQFSISVPIEGDYSDLRHFIARVENSRSFLILDGVSLTSSKEGGLQLLMNINISTYFNAPWLKDLKKPAKGARKKT